MTEEPNSRPEWITCTVSPASGKRLCSREGIEHFHFQGIDHAYQSATSGSRLRACPECVAIAASVMTGLLPCEGNASAETVDVVSARYRLTSVQVDFDSMGRDLSFLATLRQLLPIGLKSAAPAKIEMSGPFNRAVSKAGGEYEITIKRVGNGR